MFLSSLIYVSNLIDNLASLWKEEVFQDLFYPRDMEAILNISFVHTLRMFSCGVTLCQVLLQCDQCIIFAKPGISCFLAKIRVLQKQWSEI